MVRSHLKPLVIAGPTGSGKSALALALAKKHQGEIICADSRQFYRFMAIGTASPSKEDQEAIPHHGYQLVDPSVSKIDAGFFVDFAHKKIAEIQARSKRPILVGGTGLYLRALYYGLLDVPRSNPELVSELTTRAELEGLSALYQELQKIDPLSCHLIKENDRYRIIRALEIFYATGMTPSGLRVSFKNAKAQISAHWIYKKPPKDLLVKELAGRVKKIFDEGLLEEAHSLRERLPADHWALSVMGYQEALLCLDGIMTLDQAMEKTLIRHRQYAKRQYTWFNKEDFYRFVVAD